MTPSPDNWRPPGASDHAGWIPILAYVTALLWRVAYNNDPKERPASAAELEGVRGVNAMLAGAGANATIQYQRGVHDEVYASPSSDAAEGATVEVPHEDCLNCRCPPDERCAGYRTAPSKPAKPDVVREALRHADIQLSMLLPEIFATDQRTSVRNTLALINVASRSLALSRAPAVGVTREAIARKLAEFDGNRFFEIADHDKEIYFKRADAILALSPAPDTTVSARRERLENERNELDNSFGQGAFRDGQIRDRIVAIDAELAFSPQDVGRDATIEECGKIARQFDLDYSDSVLDDRDIELIKRGANEASEAIYATINALSGNGGGRG